MSFTIGDTVWVPFWVLLDHIPQPKDPFIKGTIKALAERTYRDDAKGELVTVVMCDLALSASIISITIPTTHLIYPADLQEWAERISNWIIGFRPQT